MIFVGILERRFARYLLVGAWNTAFGYGLFALFTALMAGRFPYSYVAASVLANLIAITVAFLAYKRFVFKTQGNYLREWLRCLVVYSGSIAAGVLFLPPLVFLFIRLTGDPRSSPYLAGAVLTAGTVLASFFGHRHFSFKARLRPYDPSSKLSPR